ncbi:MAG: hypothetical protein ABIP14_03840 [Blastocatellia bacterium]
MKYRRFSLFSFLLIALAGFAVGQQPSKPKRTVKNPPQYPSIIDLENKDATPAKQPNPKTGEPPIAAPAPPDAITQAMTSLTAELRNLSQELKALNVRQQMSIDLLRQSRVEQRIDRYENDLRPIRERITALETEEQRLQQLTTREALVAQTAQTASINREATIQMLKADLENRLRLVQGEKERLRKVETDQTSSLDIYQKLSTETDQKIQQAEEKLRDLEKIKPEG